MQACRRGGDAAVVRRIDRLIAILIGLRGTAPDVGRQRNLAVLGERRARVERSDKTYAPKSAAQDLDDLGGAVAAECDAPARFEFATGMHHREPRPVPGFPHDQKFGVLSTFPLAA